MSLVEPVIVEFNEFRTDYFCFGTGTDTSQFVRCIFVRCAIKAPTPGNVSFRDCTFVGCQLSDWMCKDADFVDCEFSGELRKFTIDAAHPVARDRRPRIEGNDFSQALLYDVSFRGGVELADQKLPGGKEYAVITNPPLSLALARQHVAMWPEMELQSRAEDRLTVLQYHYDHGQARLFFGPSGKRDRISRTVDARLAALLRA